MSHRRRKKNSACDVIVVIVGFFLYSYFILCSSYISRCRYFYCYLIHILILFISYAHSLVCYRVRLHTRQHINSHPLHSCIHFIKIIIIVVVVDGVDDSGKYCLHLYTFHNSTRNAMNKSVHFHRAKEALVYAIFVTFFSLSRRFALIFLLIRFSLEAFLSWTKIFHSAALAQRAADTKNRDNERDWIHKWCGCDKPVGWK